MEIKYENGRMIVTHASGQIDIYTVAQLQQLKEQASNLSVIDTDTCALIDSYIEKCNASLTL